MCFWFLAYVNDLYFTSIININQWAATIFPFSYNYNETVNNAVNGPYMHDKLSFCGHLYNTSNLVLKYYKL